MTAETCIQMLLAPDLISGLWYLQDQPEKYDECKGQLIIDETLCEKLQDHAVIMHPLPRVDEITVGVDNDPRAAYFRQAKNGLFVRMALLRLCLLGK